MVDLTKIHRDREISDFDKIPELLKIANNLANFEKTVLQKNQN